MPQENIPVWQAQNVNEDVPLQFCLLVRGLKEANTAAGILGETDDFSDALLPPSEDTRRMVILPRPNNPNEGIDISIIARSLTEDTAAPIWCAVKKQIIVNGNKRFEILPAFSGSTLLNPLSNGQFDYYKLMDALPSIDIDIVTRAFSQVRLS